MVLNDSLWLLVCYHDGSRSFASNLDDSMHFFSDAGATIPALYIGDFNWSMSVLLSVPAWVQDYTHPPGGSVVSKRKATAVISHLCF